MSNLLDKYLGEGKVMSMDGLASHIKKKYGRSISYNDLSSEMSQEGLHPDDDFPDLEDKLKGMGVKVKK